MWIESGWAQTQGDVLTLEPTTADSEGPRAFRYGFSQGSLGELTLVLIGADGVREDFYFAPP